MRRAGRLVTLATAGFVAWSGARAQHVDPAPNAGLRTLTFARHVNTAFAGNTGLPHGSAVLQRCDRISAPDQDVACGITLQQTGGIGTFGAANDGLDVVTTQAEITAVLADNTAWVKVITLIGFCGVAGNNFIGCAPTGSTIAIVNSLSADQTGETVAHEFGHNQGLGHRSNVGSPLMAPSLGGDEVNLTECAAYHVGLANNGPNTPVNFAPNVTCPNGRIVECSATGGTPASDPQLTGFFAGVSAEDGCEPTPTITNDAPAFFLLGTTSVAFTATDAGNLADTCSANVIVRDTIAPAIVCPSDVTVECTGNNGIDASDPRLAGFFAGVSATDVCDASVVLSDNAPSFFPRGTTTITFLAVDDSLRVGLCQADVTVSDTQSPTISLSLDPTLLWPPNHKLVTIAAEVAVDDACDPNPQFVLESIASSEPDNGGGDGDTPDDIRNAELGTPDLTFELRAERSGTGSGRVYTVVYRVVDGSGIESTATKTVSVPHDRGGHPLVVSEPASVRQSPTDGPLRITICSSPWFDASEIDPASVRLGDAAASLAASTFRRVDATVDGLPDLVLSFSGLAAGGSFEMTPDRPRALRYCTRSGACYLVPDIMAVGSPPEQN